MCWSLWLALACRVQWAWHPLHGVALLTWHTAVLDTLSVCIVDVVVIKDLGVPVGARKNVSASNVMVNSIDVRVQATPIAQPPQYRRTGVLRLDLRCGHPRNWGHRKGGHHTS